MRTQPAPGGLRGFALPLPDLSRPPPAAAPPPPDPALLAAIRAEGEAEGHARGFAEGMQEGLRRQAAAQEAAVAASLGTLAAAMQEAAEAGERAAAEAAEALASLLLGAMDAALPEEAARHGDVLVARVAAALLPALADRPEATLHVAPAIVEAVAARLPSGPPVAADPALPPGDARIAWRDGAQLVSLERRRAAVRAALAAAGFTMGMEGS
jgi:flagellar biosynthesis/type III secretory pathway protein FliH